MRGLVAIAIIVVILAGAWSAGWFWLADVVDRNADSVLTEIADRGVEIDCRDRGVVGFPFAVRVACTETAVAERSTGTSARLGTVTGGTSVFAPTTARMEMDSPAEVDSPYLETPAEVSWRTAGLDIGVGLNGPRDVSFDAADLAAVFALRNLPDAGLAAAHTSGTLAPAADGGTDASVTFTDLTLSADGAPFPSVSGSASGHLSVPPRALLAGRAGLAAPISARAIDIALDSEGARLNAQGELSVDAEGILDGSITVSVAGAEALPSVLSELPPQLQKIGNVMVGAVFAFGRPTTIDGEPASELVIEIVRGKAKVGMVDVGQLPRVPI